MSDMINVVVGAGRFDIRPSEVRARSRRAMRLGNVYMSTEVMRRQRAAFKDVTGTVALFGGEYAVLLNAGLFRVPRRQKALAFLSRRKFTRGVKRLQIRVRGFEPTVIYRPTKQKVRLGTAHLPAHLQDGDRFSTERHIQDEVAAHKQATNNIGRRAARRARFRPNLVEIYGIDANLDLRRDVWRDHMEEELDPLLGVWTDSRRPAMGDLGNRCVTGIWTRNVHVVEAGVLLNSNEDRHFDHRLIYMEGKI